MRAVVRLENFDDAYLIIGRFVDPKVLGYVERTQSVVSEYQQLETGRSGIQIASALLFIVVALLLLFAAVWTGLNFANQLVTPVSRLITAANRVRGGDFLARVPEEGSDADELAALGRAFNRMTAQLASQRRELIETNQELDGVGGRQGRPSQSWVKPLKPQSPCRGYRPVKASALADRRLNAGRF